MILKEEQRTAQHLNAIASMSKAHAKAVSRGELEFPDVDPFSTAYPDIDWVAREVYDTDTLLTEERQAVIKALMKQDIFNIWRVLSRDIEAWRASRLIRRCLFGSSLYTMPDFSNLHWDSYAYRIGALSYIQMCALSNVIERNKEATSQYQPAVNILCMPVWDPSLIRDFAHDYMGIHDVTDVDILRVLHAFTQVHVYDAWVVSRYAILGIDPNATKDSNQVVNRVSSIVRKLRAAAGYSPAGETLIMDIAGMVSERLYAYIKKAGTLEELIEYPSGTVRFQSQSAAITEELLNIYRSHGYPDAYIGWLDGVGSRIFVNEGGASHA